MRSRAGLPRRQSPAQAVSVVELVVDAAAAWATGVVVDDVVPEVTGVVLAVVAVVLAVTGVVLVVVAVVLVVVGAVLT